jgi:hypothetical protein
MAARFRQLTAGLGQGPSSFGLGGTDSRSAEGLKRADDFKAARRDRADSPLWAQNLHSGRAQPGDHPEARNGSHRAGPRRCRPHGGARNEHPEHPGDAHPELLEEGPAELRRRARGHLLRGRRRSTPRTTCGPRSPVLGFVDGFPYLAYPAAICTGVDVDIDRSQDQARREPRHGPLVLGRRRRPSRSSPARPTPQAMKQDKQDDPTSPAAAKISLRQVKFTRGRPPTDASGEPVTNSATIPVRREKLRSKLAITIEKSVQGLRRRCFLLECKPGGVESRLMYSRNLARLEPVRPVRRRCSTTTSCRPARG